MESNNTNTLHLIARHLVKALQPLADAVSDKESFQAFLYRQGWEADTLPAEYTELASSVRNIADLLSQLGDDPSFEEINAVIEASGNIYRQIKSISVVPAGIPPEKAAVFLENLAQNTFEILLVEYIADSLPALYAFLRTAGVIVEEDVELPASGHEVRVSKLYWDKLPDFLSDPLKVVQAIFSWGSVDFTYQLLARYLLNFFYSVGLNPYFQTVEPDYGQEFRDNPVEEDAVDLMVKIPLMFGSIGNQEIELGFGILILPADGDKLPGFAFVPLIPPQLDLDYPLTDELLFQFGANSNLAQQFGLVIRPGEALELIYPFAAGVTPANAGFEATLAFRPATPVTLFGKSGNTRLELAGAAAGVAINTDLEEIEIVVKSAVEGLTLIVTPGDSDGFLAQIFGGKDLKVPIQLALSWSNITGLNFSGGAGLTLSEAPHLEIGPLTIDKFNLLITAGFNDAEAPSFNTQFSTDFSVKLGPVNFQVSELGLQLSLLFQEGNAGPLDINYGFKPPTGIGITIDGGGFKGGGFLKFEPEEERYTGFLELEFEGKIALKAIGLLETRLPNSQDGYTLLILITAEFTPVQLGFGFTLNGVGGLLGLNRMVDIERLRTGIRDNTLGSILFPQNIVENAERIISDLRQVFPPQEGRFVFGPMAKIGWGSPTILTLDLGLLIEVPNPVRFAILGVLKGILPKEDAPVLRLQVNFLGEINLQKKQLLFDASLYDSKLLAFALTGDMAVRLYWGEDPNFLLTVGGFHPAYQPPPMNLPDIRRITLALMEGDNPRIRLETYFAVTSNTVQFGAKAELYASAWKFNVSGFIAFDVLFQFSPFRFVAEVSAMLALSVGSSPFASIKLAFALEGPTPWSVKGTASFKICWFFTLNIRFNKTWGEGQNLSLPDVAVMPLLLAALNDNNNWTAELPRRRNLLVSTREVLPMAGSELKVIVQPFGILSVSQKVVPLNLSIQKFGNLRPADGNLFRITDVRIGEHTIVQSPEVLKEHFAPAQFFEKSDAEKLSDKSFERYDSGIRLKGSGQLKSAYAAARKVKYELKYIDSQTKQRLSNPDIDLYQPDPGAFNTWVMQGAVSKSELSYANNHKPALAPGAVSLAQERFGVVDVGDLSLIDNGSLVASEAEAKATLDSLVAAKPELRGRLQVLPVFELAV